MSKVAPILDACGCTLRQARFVDLYLLLSFNATAAYIGAGYRPRSQQAATANAARLLTNDSARRYLAQRVRAWIERTGAERDRLLTLLAGVAFVDPNDLVSYHRGACRFCYGAKHRYQYTAGEWEQTLEAHEARREAALAKDRPDPGPLDVKGGTGYDKRKEPHPDCPECFGEGIGWHVIKDTRELSPAARALYAGVQDTESGARVLMHSQDKARGMLAEILGICERRGEGQAPINSDDLARAFAETLERSRARGATLRAERCGLGQG